MGAGNLLMPVTADDDYLFLEDAFIQRIKSEVAGLANVEGMPDLQSLGDQIPQSPAVYVIYLGDAVPQGVTAQGASKAVQKVEQRWGLVLGINVADSTGDGVAARRAAGPLLSQLIMAITGWHPEGIATPITRAPGATPAQYNDGLYFFPVVFSATIYYPKR